MTQRYSDEWRKKVSDGVKRAKQGMVISEETRKKLSDAAKKGNAGRTYKRKEIHSLKSEKQVRTRIIELRGARCEKCGWSEVNPYSGTVPVQVNHIDGNPDNNSLGNLEILCPNHHSISEFFMHFGRRSKEPNSRTLKRYKYMANKGT